MSIFLKQVHQLTFEDIRELLREGAEENIRLEFKREYPGKSNLLKKMSAFANTYGGYIIMGIDEDGRGRAKSLPGVERINRFDQTIVQWCFEEIFPPIIPYVSPPIPHGEIEDRYFYVIYVEQSMETPHVLNKSRNGLYVRTDEYSQKFLTRLAKFDELEYLMSKRRKAEDFVNSLLSRASQRLETHKVIHFEEHHGTDSLLTLCLIPSFPHSRMFGAEKLLGYAQQSVQEARGGVLPDFSDSKIHSQFESIISENPGISYYSYFEINIYNMLYYVCDVTREYQYENINGSPFLKVIPLKVLMAEIILFLRYAGSFFANSGFDGLLNFIVAMDNIKGRQLRIEDHQADPRRISYLDNHFQTRRSLSVRDLSNEEMISGDLFRELCFSLGFKRIYDLSPDQLTRFYTSGLKYLSIDRQEENL